MGTLKRRTMNQVWNLSYFILSTSILTSGFPQKNPIVEGLRALFSGNSDGPGGFKLNILDDLSIPSELIPQEFKFIKSGLCGSARTRKCFCEENAEIETIVFPRRDSVTFKDIKRIFAQCRPTKCICSNDEERIVTNFGCINGGVPRCRINGKVSNSGPFGMMDPLSCKSPEKTLSEWDFIVAKTEEKAKCICKSGIFPICSENEKIPLCPDGNRADRKLTKLPPFLDLCLPADRNFE